MAVGISLARKSTFLFVKKVLLSYYFLFVFVILLSKMSLSLLFPGKKILARKSLYVFLVEKVFDVWPLGGHKMCSDARTKHSEMYPNQVAAILDIGS